MPPQGIPLPLPVRHSSNHHHCYNGRRQQTPPSHPACKVTTCESERNDQPVESCTPQPTIPSKASAARLLRRARQLCIHGQALYGCRSATPLPKVESHARGKTHRRYLFCLRQAAQPHCRMPLPQAGQQWCTHLTAHLHSSHRHSMPSSCTGSFPPAEPKHLLNSCMTLRSCCRLC